MKWKITTNEKEWFGSEDMRGKTAKNSELNYASSLSASTYCPLKSNLGRNHCSGLKNSSGIMKYFEHWGPCFETYLEINFQVI